MFEGAKDWLRERAPWASAAGEEENSLLRTLCPDFPQGAVGNARLRDFYFDLLRKLKPGVFCDIGAHDGEASLSARRALADCKIYAFEANPEVHKIYAARLCAAGIRYLNLAIRDRNGEATLHAPRILSKEWKEGEIRDASLSEPYNTAKTSLLRRNEDATYVSFEVEAQSLDAFFRKERVAIAENLFALWIDVEGASAAVLAGAKKVLRSTAIIFIEVENYEFWKGQKKAPEICRFLQRRGFIPVARDREYGDQQFNVVFLKSAYTNFLPRHLSKTSAAGNCFPSSQSPQRKDIPIFIPSFNNPTYLRGMIEQLSNLGLTNLIVVDNASDFPPLLKYLESIEATTTVIRERENRGPRAIYKDLVYWEMLPQYFCITDPDLEFNPNLPSDFLLHLIDLTERHRVGKAGFALDVSEPEKMTNEIFQIGDVRCRIWEWEAQFWQDPLEGAGEDVAYRATLDTTFAVYNKSFFSALNPLDAIRVAGRYTCRHLPWYLGDRVPPDEAAYYRARSKHSFYQGAPPPS